ncbi:MAG: hypothetical protein ABJA79_02475 [Parafilimonas sp.]
MLISPDYSWSRNGGTPQQSLLTLHPAVTKLIKSQEYLIKKFFTRRLTVNYYLQRF